jgi:hypothetical protein
MTIKVSRSKKSNSQIKRSSSHKYEYKFRPTEFIGAPAFDYYFIKLQGWGSRKKVENLDNNTNSDIFAPLSNWSVNEIIVKDCEGVELVPEVIFSSDGQNNDLFTTAPVDLNVYKGGQGDVMGPHGLTGLTDGTSGLTEGGCTIGDTALGTTVLAGDTDGTDAFWNNVQTGNEGNNTFFLKVQGRPAEVIIIQGDLSETGLGEENITPVVDQLSAAPNVKINVGPFLLLNDFVNNDHSFAGVTDLPSTGKSEVTVVDYFASLAVTGTNINPALFEPKPYKNSEGQPETFDAASYAWTSVELWGDNDKIYGGNLPEPGFPNGVNAEGEPTGLPSSLSCCDCSSVPGCCYWKVNRICAFNCDDLSLDIGTNSTDDIYITSSSNTDDVGNMIDCDHDTEWTSSCNEACPEIIIRSNTFIKYFKFLQTSEDNNISTTSVGNSVYVCQSAQEKVRLTISVDGTTTYDKSHSSGANISSLFYPLGLTSSTTGTEDGPGTENEPSTGEPVTQGGEPGTEPEVPCGCVQLLGLTIDAKNETALKMQLNNPPTVPTTIYLVGIPCDTETCTDPCEHKYQKYYDLVNKINADSVSATLKGAMTTTLMELVKQDAQNDGLLVNQVAYDAANEKYNYAAPYEIDQHQIFLHNLTKEIRVESPSANHPLASANHTYNSTDPQLADSYKFMIFCEDDTACNNNPPNCCTEFEVCLDDCCYNIDEIRASNRICITNGSPIGLFESEECCCVAELYKELNLLGVDGLNLDTRWRVHEIALTCEKPDKNNLEDALYKSDKEQYKVQLDNDPQGFTAVSGVDNQNNEDKTSCAHPDEGWYWGATSGNDLNPLEQTPAEDMDEENLVDNDKDTYWATKKGMDVDSDDKGLIELMTNEPYRYLLIDQGKADTTGPCGGLSKNSVSSIKITISGVTKKVSVGPGITCIDLIDEAGFTKAQLFKLKSNESENWTGNECDRTVADCGQNEFKDVVFTKKLNTNLSYKEHALSFKIDNITGSYGTGQNLYFVTKDQLDAGIASWLGSGVTALTHSIAVNFDEAEVGDNTYGATIDFNGYNNKTLYMVYDPQSVNKSPDFDKAVKLLIDSNYNITVETTEEESKVEETNKRPVVIIRKKKSTSKKPAAKKLAPKKKSAPKKKRSNKFKGFKKCKSCNK